MPFSAASVLAVLQAELPKGATGLVVAVSGGMDSACLLTALAQAQAAVQGAHLPLRAIHVDHGLGPAAAEFRHACALLCRKLDIPLEVVAVAVDPGGSIEAAARDARYRGIAERLKPGECLLTAHHALDQAETLMLQLLRGAGLKGLAAMPRCRPLGTGWHLRPLLEVAKPDLRKFGEQLGIVAVSDPMNEDERFERAYLRARLWPQLEKRWPGAATALSRSAQHVADAQDILDASAALAVQRLRDGEALSVTGLRVLPVATQRNVLRHWIAGRAMTPPSTARLNEVLRQITDAKHDRLPSIVWGRHALRRYRDRLFLTAETAPCVGPSREWQRDARLELGAGLGTLVWSSQLGGLDGTRMPTTVSVRQRRGGETLKPHRQSRTQSLQHLCQAAGVLPWMRTALPLIYAGDALIAVGDMWLDARWCVAAGQPGVGPVWEDAPVIV